MKISVTSKYIVFPVNTEGTDRKLRFLKDGKCVYELNIRLDTEHSDFEAFIDISRFSGKELELCCDPETDIGFRFSDRYELNGEYDEPLRPQAHFTPKNGWLNDPNGLIYLDGVYHMFFQYNPALNKWDNMHWGHAVSRDLIHWEQLETALFPENSGAAFSGSAILPDKATGFFEDKPDAAVIFYTDTSDFSQRIRYSTDGFKTIIKPENDTVIPHIIEDNRDPSVSYCDEIGKYVMAIYLTGNSYALFSSPDLFNWEKFQEIVLPGECECPDIFCMTDENGGRHWVLMGACDRYYIGNFKDGKFVPSQDIKPLNFSSTGYAGQTFSNMPDGRTVRTVWDKWDIPTKRINGQMGIPMDLKLREINGEYYIVPLPVKEIAGLFLETDKKENIRLDKTVNEPLRDTPYHITLSGVSDGKTAIELTLFGRKFTVSLSDNTLKFCGCSLPLTVSGKNFSVEIISDRCSLEFFSETGAGYMAFANRDSVCDRSMTQLSISADGDHILEKMELHPLKAIWKEEK